MTAQSRLLSRSYQAALRKHLAQDGEAGLAAGRLGRRAVRLGLDTLALAQMHEAALMTLQLPSITTIKRATVFFMAVIAPMEATHQAATQSRLDLKRVRADCAKSSRLHHQSLDESIELQKHLRQLTHRVLAAQEAERVKLSHELQDEIAQTLLGINVRLLALKKEARSGKAGLQKEITRTQRLVLRSARSVRKFARELGIHHPAS